MKCCKDKFGSIVAALCVIDLLIGLIVLYRFWVAIHSRVIESNGAVFDVQITTDWWTVTRPLFFAFIFAAVFWGNKRKGKTGKLVIALSFLTGLIYYFALLTWFDVVAIYQDYLFPEPLWPLVFNLFGWSEWDLVRGSLLTALLGWWLWRTFRLEKAI